MECPEEDRPLGLNLLGDLGRSVYHLGLELSDEGIRLGHFQAAYFFFFMIQIQTKLKIIYGLPFLSSNENA